MDPKYYLNFFKQCSRHKCKLRVENNRYHFTSKLQLVILMSNIEVITLLFLKASLLSVQVSKSFEEKTSGVCGWVGVREREKKRERIEKGRTQGEEKVTAAAAQSGILIRNSINTYQIPEKPCTLADAPVNTCVMTNQKSCRITQ